MIGQTLYINDVRNLLTVAALMTEEAGAATVPTDKHIPPCTVSAFRNKKQLMRQTRCRTSPLAVTMGQLADRRQDR